MLEETVRILLIEDDNGLRATLIELLEERGYWVRGVPSSDKAIELAHQSSFDLVVTDIRTEGEHDGLSALAQVKERQPEVAAVVITGYSTEDYALRAVKLQVEDYLKKPFQLHDFLHRVDTIARRKLRLKQEAKERAAVRETIRWFAERVARAVTFGDQDFDLERFFQTVDSLVETSALEKNLQEDIRLAASLAIAEENEDLELPEGVQETLPPSVLHFVYHSREHWDGSGEPDGLAGSDIPLGSRIIQLASATGAHRGVSSLELHRRYPGRFDPDLIHQEKDEYADRGSDDEKIRSLLLLGGTLEDVGNKHQALDSYRELTSKYPNSRLAINAWLGIARIFQEQGQGPQAVESAREALQRARQKGPGLLALSALEAGLLLSQGREELGKEALEEASELLRQFRDQGGRALSLLALAHFWRNEGSTEAALDAIVSDRFTSEFVRAAPWLLEFALERLPQERVKPVFVKGARDCPVNLVNLCSDITYPTEQRASVFSLVKDLLPSESLTQIVQRLANHPQDEVRLRADQMLHAHRKGQDPSLPTLRLFTFGGIRVFRGTERIDRDWRRQKVQYFLAYLLQLGDRSLSDESIVDVFWPGPLKKGRISLRGALSYLRKKLVPDFVSEEVNYFLKPPGLVKLNTALPIWYDLLEFERSLSQFRKLQKSSKPEAAVTLAHQLVNLYQGPFLEDCYMDWATETRERTDFAATEALLFLQDNSLKNRRFGEVVEFGERALAVDPSSEMAYEGLMRAYLAQARASDALKIFQKCETILSRELGLEPSETLLELRDQAMTLS